MSLRYTDKLPFLCQGYVDIVRFLLKRMFKISKQKKKGFKTEIENRKQETSTFLYAISTVINNSNLKA